MGKSVQIPEDAGEKYQREVGSQRCVSTAFILSGFTRCHTDSVMNRRSPFPRRAPILWATDASKWGSGLLQLVLAGMHCLLGLDGQRPLEAHCHKPGETARSAGQSHSSSRSRSGCTLDRFDKVYLNANLILEASDIRLTYFNLQLSVLWKESNS